MKWLTERFIKKAQDSPLAIHIPRDKIPEVLKLVATGKNAVIRLLTSTGEVIEITECDLPLYMRKARTYLQDNAPQYRDSITSILTASSGLSSAHSILSNQSRVSVASTNTNVSIFSLANSNLVRKPVTIPTHFARPEKKAYICPACPAAFKRDYDLAKHVKDFHEREVKVYQCPYCEQSSEEQRLVDQHCRLAHPGHPPYSNCLPSFDKVAYGCSFCEECLSSLDEYVKCIQVDQKKDPSSRPVPSRRLRALLRQSKDIADAVNQACERHNLAPDAWKQFVWDDDICDKNSRRLEYGCNGPYDIQAPGIDDIDEFMDELLEKAKDGSTGLPVLRLKYSVGPPGTNMSDGAALAPGNAGINVRTGSGFSHYSESTPGSTTQTPYFQNMYISTPTDTSTDVALHHDHTEPELNRIAQQRHDLAPPMFDAMDNATKFARQKRHRSQDSTILPESSYRVKRHPIMSELVQSGSDFDHPEHGTAWTEHSVPPRPDMNMAPSMSFATATADVGFIADTSYQAFGNPEMSTSQPHPNPLQGFDFGFDHQNFPYPDEGLHNQQYYPQTYENNQTYAQYHPTNDLQPSNIQQMPYNRNGFNYWTQYPTTYPNNQQP